MRQSGLAALAHVTGALAASYGIVGGATLATPEGCRRFAADRDGWPVTRVAAGTRSGTAVEAPADVLLEAASGRINPVAAVARRKLKMHDLGGRLRPAPAGGEVEIRPLSDYDPALGLTDDAAGGVA